MSKVGEIHVGPSQFDNSRQIAISKDGTRAYVTGRVAVEVDLQRWLLPGRRSIVTRLGWQPVAWPGGRLHDRGVGDRRLQSNGALPTTLRSPQSPSLPARGTSRRVPTASGFTPPHRTRKGGHASSTLTANTVIGQVTYRSECWRPLRFHLGRRQRHALYHGRLRRQHRVRMSPGGSAPRGLTARRAPTVLHIDTPMAGAQLSPKFDVL